MWGTIRFWAAGAGVLACAMSGAGAAGAQDLSFPTLYNSYGYPGLIDMPSGLSAPDGELAVTASYFRNQLRTTLTFQVTERLSASFRYANLYDISLNQEEGFRFDRSLSLAYRVLDEGIWTPSVTIGLNDFLGTGIYGSEYIAATRHLTPDLRVTGGIGWGRFAGVNSFENPLGRFDDRFLTRQDERSGFGGEVEFGQIFTGPAAVFGGVEWRATDDLTVVAEYSSDAYPFEDGFAFERRSPFNIGLDWQATERINVAARYLYGSELGVQVTYAVNPARPSTGSGLGDAPPPVRGLAFAPASTGLQARTAAALAEQGITLHGFEAAGGMTRVEVINDRYGEPAQAIGRVARVLSRTQPGDVTAFGITLIERGLPVSTATIRRADMETLEFEVDNAWSSLTRARLEDAGPGTDPVTGLYPRFSYGITPYISPALFDPDAPIRADAGVDVNASFEPAPGLILSGTLRQRLIGNLDEADRPSTSPLPRVRSESNIYGREADTTIPNLQLAYYVRPGENLYGRVTAGYLEPMFGGVSAELLWMPPNSRLALGAELNYAVQRDFDQLFGFRDYDVVTGHLSAYYDLGNSFHVQIDAGRYLAGDWGATFALDREFGNGWRVGGFFTLTDVPFDEFGEGSFDKGIRITVPIDWISGQPTRERFETVIRPVLRDGGARLNVDGRLYDLLRDERPRELTEGWGRFWR